MRSKLTYFILLIILLSPSSSQASRNSFSAKVGDVYLYTIESHGDTGNVEITVANFTYASTLMLPVESNTIYTFIHGIIKGEYHGDVTTMEVKTGWRSLLYMNTSHIISYDQYKTPLYSLIYDGKYPFLWPTNDSFYTDFRVTDTIHNDSISVHKEDNTWIIRELIDDTPVDGCFCQTEIKVENGVATSIIQNETYFFTFSGPLSWLSNVTLDQISPNETQNSLVFMELSAFIVFIPIYILRKRRIHQKSILRE